MKQNTETMGRHKYPKGLVPNMLLDVYVETALSCSLSAMVGHKCLHDRRGVLRNQMHFSFKLREQKTEDDNKQKVPVKSDSGSVFLYVIAVH